MNKTTNTTDTAIAGSLLLCTVFYRVSYNGFIEQYLTDSFNKETNRFKFKIAPITDFTGEQYNFKPEIKYWASSEFGMSVIKENNNKEWFESLDEAKTISLERFEKVINQNGKYRVARYFDDMFEKYVTDILDKKSAQQEASELNKKSRHYVSYQVVSVNCA